MTNEEVYERITSVLKEQGIAINQFELKVTSETGKYPNLRITKSRLSLPNTVAFPYLTMFFNDDEMHELTLKKMNNSGTGGEAMGLIRLVLCTVPAILLLTSKQCAKAVGYIAVFSAFYAVQIYVLPHLTGILNFLVLFTTGFFCRILPSVAIAAYAVKTTTVSELISGMERIHMPKEVTIPLTVMFRFFPTVFQESEAISDAMKMRGIKLGGKKSSKILEYKLIPMITCSVKIGEELSAAAITRGLGAPVKRTNICQLKFNFADVVLILFCCFVVFWAIASPIISAGGILP